MSPIMNLKLKNNSISLFALVFLFFSQSIFCEMLIGTGSIQPGVDLIFEGGIKDDIMPNEFYLSENETDIHLEVLANWSNDSPDGSPLGGHVAYLNVSATVINEADGISETHILTPHVNMADNLHYAKNIKLPGEIDQEYTVIFEILPPKMGDLGMHFDWREKVDSSLISGQKFEFKNLDFKEIALSERR
jgi:uncharacterized protein involved in high-affinity Fe2+ transport